MIQSFNIYNRLIFLFFIFYHFSVNQIVFKLRCCAVAVLFISIFGRINDWLTNQKIFKFYLFLLFADLPPGSLFFFKGRLTLLGVGAGNWWWVRGHKIFTKFIFLFFLLKINPKIKLGRWNSWCYPHYFGFFRCFFISLWFKDEKKRES